MLLYTARKQKKFHLLYRYASCSAAGSFDLISALSPSIQGITKHFSVTTYISPAFYNTYFIILSGAFVHMFAELSLPLAVFCCQPCRSRTQHKTTSHSPLNSHCTPLLLAHPLCHILTFFIRLDFISFTISHSLTHFSLFLCLSPFVPSIYNLGVQMRRYI